MKRFKLVGASLLALFVSNVASAVMIEVTVTNNSPAGGTYLTPVWVGLHNGSFDLYNQGEQASAGLEAIAEDGNAAPLSDEFSASSPEGVQGVVGGAPIAPGQTVTLTLDVASDGSNNYFSYASMVLPSSDFFVGNGDPFAVSIASILNGSVSEISMNIGTPGTVLDAGTEINDFDFTAGNGLFGLSGGQTGPNQGADQNGVVTLLPSGNPYVSFLNLPDGIDLDALNFNDPSWNNGLATITIRAVPVPAALPLFIGALSFFGLLRRRRVS